ncbi:DUF917 domain-containing protein [Emergencia timonensis]|uniref:DUF917 domain-containing protein n=1 Tax=Emergencia timonensis TaxID=1776384 RepID=UPI0039918B3C
MKKLTKQEIIDILYGCTIVGTGGGGDLDLGLRTMQEDFDQGRELYMADLSEVPDDAYVAVPYMCGSPASLEGGGDEFSHLPQLGYPESLLAFRTLEDYFGQKFYGAVSTELGGANTAYALHAACQLGVPIVDADPAGRSVPELQHSTFYVKDIPMAPIALATQFGDAMIVKDIVNDMRAEDIVRAVAIASGNKVGVADHAITGKQLKGAIIPNALSYTLKLGEALRKAKENGEDVVQKVVEAGEGKILFRGIVKEWKVEETGGFIFGDTVLTGTGEYEGHEYKVWYKNEHLVSYLDGKVDICAPDLICVIDNNTGMPVTNPNYENGMDLSVFVLPAPEIWKTERGLEVFGPRSFGFDFDYVPFNER